MEHPFATMGSPDVEDYGGDTEPEEPVCNKNHDLNGPGLVVDPKNEWEKDNEKQTRSELRQAGGNE